MAGPPLSTLAAQRRRRRGNNRVESPTPADASASPTPPPATPAPRSSQTCRAAAARNSYHGRAHAARDHAAHGHAAHGHAARPAAGPDRNASRTTVNASPFASMPSPSSAGPTTLYHAPNFPLASLFWPARGSASQQEVLPLILMVAALFRWAAGFWGYSGYQSPPMHGDYEAQRHWMEITTQLPISQWYFHDLQWWGLDYPPLTAYHMWLLGKIGSLINPAWFALYTSRGSDDPSLKIFMRATVLASEFALYVPAAVLLVRRYARLSGVSTWISSLALAALLLQPSLILIDHVHFQYNNVMLGFVLLSMACMMSGSFGGAALWFVLALAYKQMALFYSLPVFAFFLGKCLFPRIDTPRFVRIAMYTAATGVWVLVPLLAGTLCELGQGIGPGIDLDGPPMPLRLFPCLNARVDPRVAVPALNEQLSQLVFRVFPLARGLFEGKVANFWCTLNLFVRLHVFPAGALQYAAAAAVLAAAAPPSVVLFLRPRRLLLPLALATSAWGFFLFGYQVHEKSVLLPLMPTTLLLAGRDGMAMETRAWVGFANALGAWTMFPLLRRVGLAVPYAVLTLLWAYLLGLPPTSMSAYAEGGRALSGAQITTLVLHLVFYSLMASWHLMEATVEPPPTKPDMWVVINAALGAVGFAMCYAWCFWKLVAESGVLSKPVKIKKAKSN